MKGFGSDNHSGVHPEIFRALQNCNQNHAPSYGTDSHTEAAVRAFRNLFGSHTEVFFVFNGTASNSLSLAFLCERFQSVLCSEVSHLNLDECGAPEFFAGKLIPVEHSQGKISLQSLQENLIRRGDQHYSQSQVVSLTQPTELGTCYTLEEIRDITSWAHQNGLYVHLDGARLSNALVHLNCSFKELTTDLGVDAVSFGGTKNGLMMGEAILILNPELAKKSRQRLKYIRKQAAQLPSKTRFIAAQFECYLQNELYLSIAKHACTMARRLSDGLMQIPGIHTTASVESNAVFVILPKAWIKALREHYFFYIWDERTYECRLMTSWDTTPEEVDDFIHRLSQLSQSQSRS